MHKCKTLLPFGAIAAALLLTATAANSAEFKDRTVKLSYVVAKDNPIGLGVARFGEIVNQKSGGKIKVRGYPDGQLGAEVQSVSAAQGGVLEMAVVSTAGAATAVKEFGLFDFPFLFNDEREADAVLDGSVGKKVLDKLADKNLVGLCYWEYGFRQVINSKRPVNKIEDLQGLKIRTIQNPVFIDSINGLGANATPMAFTEIYTGLESKAIDGAETPYNTVYSSKFYEVQKFVSGTRHIYGPAVVVVGRKFWDQLSADEKKTFEDSCAEAREYQRKVNREYDPKMLAELKAKGMVFNEVTPQERSRMRERVKPVIDKHTKAIGEELVAQTYAELEKVRKQR